MNPIYAIAALLVLIGSSLTCAKADDVPASSAPSCQARGPRKMVGLSSEELAATGALFVKLCTANNGALIYGDDPEVAHDLKRPGRLIGPAPNDFYPPAAKRLQQRGAVYLACIFDTDGKIAGATVVKSSGYPQLDNAAVKWTRAISSSSPAYWNSTPVRMFTVLRVELP